MRLDFKFNDRLENVSDKILTDKSEKSRKGLKILSPCGDTHPIPSHILLKTENLSSVKFY